MLLLPFTALFALAKQPKSKLLLYHHFWEGLGSLIIHLLRIIICDLLNLLEGESYRERIRDRDRETFDSQAHCPNAC